MKLSTARELRNLRREAQSNWYRITNQADGPTKVDIFDEIGYWGMTAQDFISELRKLTGDIELHLNSPGGEVMDGLTIYNNLRQHDGTVSVQVDGMAASIASVIAMAASPGALQIHANAQMMIHNASGLCIGTSSDMRELADLLDRQTTNIACIYAARSGLSIGDIKAAMETETYYIGQEAVDAGLADSVIPSTTNKQPVEQPPALPDDFDPSNYRDLLKGACK